METSRTGQERREGSRKGQIALIVNRGYGAATGREKMGMHLHLRRNGEARRLPKPIQDYMRYRFMLLPEYLGLLRCFEYQGEVNGKSVRRISIFSPNRVEEKHFVIKTRQDLEQHPEMLLFEGYIDRQGNAYVADRRAPIRKTRAG
jgi:hypothetical protein